MGIRSDVAIALKNNVLEGLSAESKKTLTEWFLKPEGVTEEGHVFFFGETLAGGTRTLGKSTRVGPSQ